MIRENFLSLSFKRISTTDDDAFYANVRPPFLFEVSITFLDYRVTDVARLKDWVGRVVIGTYIFTNARLNSSHLSFSEKTTRRVYFSIGCFPMFESALTCARSRSFASTRGIFV